MLGPAPAFNLPPELLRQKGALRCSWKAEECLRIGSLEEEEGMAFLAGTAFGALGSIPHYATFSK